MSYRLEVVHYSLAVIENHRYPNKSDYSYANLLVEDQWGARAEAVYVAAMKGRARKYVRK